jgi:hypothetical protein
MHTAHLRTAGILAILGAVASTSHAQEATNTPAATALGVGSVYFSQRFRYSALANDPTSAKREADIITSTTEATYGLAKDLSLRLSVPLKFESVSHHAGSPSESTDTNSGLADPTILLRWALHRIDHGPVDTTRFLVFAGSTVPSGSDELSSNSFDPIVGLAMTTIHGRHGVSLGASYTFTTAASRDQLEFGDSLSDAITADAAYLYRLEPESWSSDTPGAWYAQCELNTRAETSGDWESFISPGILYEGRRWAAEASLSIPIAEHLDHRPETTVAVTLGFRLLF